MGGSEKTRPGRQIFENHLLCHTTNSEESQEPYKGTKHPKKKGVKKEVFEEQQKLQYEIRDARRVYEDSLEVGTYEIETYPDGSYETHFVPDWGYRLQCLREYEHLAGPIYHQVDHYTEIAHNRMMSATKAANYAVNKLNSTKFTVGNYLNRGKQYIAKMTPHIEQYIQNKI